MIVQTNMDKIIISVILTFVLFAGSAYAKSENSNSGNAGGNSNSNPSSNSHGNASVGEVKEVNPNKITIEENKTNKKIEADVDEDTEVIHQNNRGSSINRGKGSTSSIRKDDTVALVSTDSAGRKEGKIGKVLKIFVKEATTSGQSKRRAIQGVVLSIDGSTINIAHQIHRDRTNIVFTDSATLFKIKGIEDGSIADVNVGNRIAAVGEATGSGILARRVHVIPGKATGIFRRLPVSTDSATESATPSGIPASPSGSLEPTLEPTPEATSSTQSGVLTEGINLFQSFLNSLLNLFGISK